MSKQNFDKVASRMIKGSNFIPLFVVTVGIFLISIYCGIEDFMTSKRGYESIDTRTVLPGIAYVVALIPQLGQIFSGYFFIAFVADEEEGNDLATALSFFLWLSLFVVDLYTDTIYKSGGAMTAQHTGISLFVFTLGSELFFTTSFGILWRVTPKAILEIKRFSIELRRAFNGKGEPQKRGGRGTQQKPKRSGNKPQRAGNKPQQVPIRSRERPQPPRSQQPPNNNMRPHGDLIDEFERLSRS